MGRLTMMVGGGPAAVTNAQSACTHLAGAEGARGKQGAAGSAAESSPGFPSPWTWPCNQPPHPVGSSFLPKLYSMPAFPPHGSCHTTQLLRSLLQEPHTTAHPSPLRLASAISPAYTVHFLLLKLSPHAFTLTPSCRTPSQDSATYRINCLAFETLIPLASSHRSFCSFHRILVLVQ